MTRFVGYLGLVRAHFLQALYAWWLWGMFFICILSSFSATASRHSAYQDALDRYSVELQERLRLRLQSAVGPSGRQLDRSLRVLRPPNPASLLIAGVEPTIPSGWDFGPAGAESRAPYSSQDPLGALDVLTDPEAVIRVLGGLLGMSLGFWMVSIDREHGWLRLPTVFPVPDWQLTGAILFAGCLTLALISMVWVTAVLVFAARLLGPEHDLAVSLWPTVFFVWGYLATMFGIGAAVAGLTRSPIAATAMTAATWTVLILLGPQFFSAIAGFATNATPGVRMEQERRETYADQQRIAEQRLVEQLVASAPPSASVFELDRAATAAFPHIEQEWRKEMRAARAQADETLRSWLADQRRWLGAVRFILRLTPGTLLQSSLADISGQGWEARREWEDAIAAHEVALNRKLFDDRGTLNLRLPWNDTSVSWTHFWHAVRPHSELPQFDSAAVQPQVHSVGDLSAAVVQVVLVLLIAALGPVRASRRALGLERSVSGPAPARRSSR